MKGKDVLKIYLFPKEIQEEKHFRFQFDYLI